MNWNQSHHQNQLHRKPCTKIRPRRPNCVDHTVQSLYTTPITHKCCYWDIWDVLESATQWHWQCKDGYWLETCSSKCSRQWMIYSRLLYHISLALTRWLNNTVRTGVSSTPRLPCCAVYFQKVYGVHASRSMTRTSARWFDSFLYLVTDAASEVTTYSGIEKYIITRPPDVHCE